jgi:hypothetical protein
MIRTTSSQESKLSPKQSEPPMSANLQRHEHEECNIPKEEKAHEGIEELHPKRGEQKGQEVSIARRDRQSYGKWPKRRVERGHGGSPAAILWVLVMMLSIFGAVKASSSSSGSKTDCEVLHDWVPHLADNSTSGCCQDHRIVCAEERITELFVELNL